MFKLTVALCILAVATAGDCKFSYQAWTKCSKSCGTGIQYRNVKVAAYPTAGGKACPTSATRTCNSQPCKVHCQFTYQPWTSCTKACGTGVQYRHVKITQKAGPGGKACPSTSTTRTCNSHKCVTPGKDCKVGAVTLKHNWFGAGLGKNFCKLYSCKNGKYSKVDKRNKKVCGWHNTKGKGVQKCSHTTCTFKSALSVKHHHAEKKGEDHRCVHNLFTNQCHCWCYGRKNVIWRPYTKGGPKRVF